MEVEFQQQLPQKESKRGKYIRTPESRQKLSASLKGKKNGPKQIEAVRKANSHPMSDEHRAKISASLKQKYYDNRVNNGSSFTEEHCNRISETQKIKKRNGIEH